MITVQEYARRMNVSRSTVFDWISKPGKKMSPLLVYGDSYGDSRLRFREASESLIFFGAGNGIRKLLLITC